MPDMQDYDFIPGFECPSCVDVLLSPHDDHRAGGAHPPADARRFDVTHVVPGRRAGNAENEPLPRGGRATCRGNPRPPCGCAVDSTSTLELGAVIEYSPNPAWASSVIAQAPPSLP